MNATTKTELAALHGQDEENSNTSGNRSLMDIVDAQLSRRGVLRAGLGGAGMAVFGALAGCGGGNDGDDAVPPAPQAPALGFSAVAKHTDDRLAVPAGYTATVLYAMGDPLAAATPAFKNDGTDTGFETRAGDHHDGMEFYGLKDDGSGADANGSKRGILAMNHEALTDQFLHAAGVTANPRPVAEADKEIPAHGLSFIEVRNADGSFRYIKDSARNGRVTPLTPMRMNGPVRGNALLVTRYSTDGTEARGTINNCGTGTTPWGTFLTGEENWAGYFTRSATDDTARGGAAARSVVSLNRYGRAAGAASRHGWETAGTDDRFARWDISQTGASTDGRDDYRNELNTFGWIVEADPYDRTQTLRKRSALGRFAHESAAFGLPAQGKPLAVYMGDDSRGEYIYKFVSTANWDAADATPANRITTGDKYLDRGQLFVARFEEDGSGTWILLDIGNSAIAGYAAYRFADQADVLVNARLAADAVGATRMDRPEWTAVHPVTGEVYCALTNNSNRKVEPAGSSQMRVDPANPRSYQEGAGAAGNINGHIVRMREGSAGSTARTFSWDIYLFGAEAGMDGTLINLSGLGDDQDFSSPDGLWFSRATSLAYIQTDDGAYTDKSNCMMLVGMPGEVGDGEARKLEYTRADGSKLAVTTQLGAKPDDDTLRRFLVGPIDCEITGITETPDGRAIFVNIQHPGESIAKADIGDTSKFRSHWPGNAGYGAGGNTARPRSATVVITRNDGGLVALDGDARKA